MLLVVIPLLLVVFLMLLIVGVRERRIAARELSAPARAARRRGLLTSAVAVLAVVLVAGVPLPLRPDVRVAMLPALTALAAVVVSALGERFAPKPAGDSRVAVLGIRRGTDAGRLRLLFTAGLVVSTVVLLVGALTAAPDGRSVTRTWAEGSGTSGPYPGWAYGLPVGTALLVLALATWWALRAVDTRPAIEPTSEPLALDRAVRLGSRIRVLRFAAAGALATAAGLSLQMGATLNSLAQSFRIATVDAPPAERAPIAPFDWVQNGGFALIVVGLAALVGVVLALTWDAPPLPASRNRPSPTAAGTHQPVAP